MAAEKVSYESVPLKDGKEDTLPQKKPPTGWGTRHTQAVLLFLSLTIGISMRAQLSVSIVAMTSKATFQMWHPNISKHCVEEVYFNKFMKVSNVTEEVGADGDRNVTNINDVTDEDIKCVPLEDIESRWNIYRIYKWNKKTQEMILFSFFVGYTLMQVPMSILAQKFGGKMTVMIALGANGVLSILTPWFPLFAGWIGICVCRFLQGITQAAYYPSIHTLLAKWAPLEERGRLGSYIYTGSQFGTVVGFQIAGLFAGTPSLGWPATFWFCGVSSLVCFILLAIFGAASPYDHPSISAKELVYIAGDGSSDLEHKKRQVPWKEIITCPAVLGIVVTQIGSSTSYMFVLTQIPLYMNKILGFDIKKNGILSSLPYLSMYVTSIAFGYVGDWFLNKKIMSVVNVRRVGNTIGVAVCGAFLVAFCYVKNPTAAVVLLNFCLALHSGVHCGFPLNMIDLSPNFAGSIMALGNMIGSLFTLVVPVLVSNILGDDVTNHHKWQILFLIMGGFQFSTNLAFVVFARGSPQPWNFIEDTKDSDCEKDILDFKRSEKSEDKNKKL